MREKEKIMSLENEVIQGQKNPSWSQGYVLGRSIEQQLRVPMLRQIQAVLVSLEKIDTTALAGARLFDEATIVGQARIALDRILREPSEQPVDRCQRLEQERDVLARAFAAATRTIGMLVDHLPDEVQLVKGDMATIKAALPLIEKESGKSVASEKEEG